jgi:hypothetical protein
MAQKTFIKKEKNDFFHCVCGNTDDDCGFYPCDPDGNEVEPTIECWPDDLYCCDRCGRIIDSNTLEVISCRKPDYKYL